MQVLNGHLRNSLILNHAHPFETLRINIGIFAVVIFLPQWARSTCSPGRRAACFPLKRFIITKWGSLHAAGFRYADLRRSLPLKRPLAALAQQTVQCSGQTLFFFPSVDTFGMQGPDNACWKSCFIHLIPHFLQFLTKCVMKYLPRLVSVILYTKTPDMHVTVSYITQGRGCFCIFVGTECPYKDRNIWQVCFHLWLVPMRKSCLFFLLLLFFFFKQQPCFRA